MYFIRTFLFLLGFLYCNTAWSQENITGFFQPKISVNSKVTKLYTLNFSLAQRNFIYNDSDIQFKTRQLDLVHFSKLKIKDNQSIALGIQYRFRKLFESNSPNELRLSQQFNTTHKTRVNRYGHRLRSEQRITSEATIHRFRYRFTLDFPLQGQQLDIGEAYFIGNTESLLSVSKNTTPEYDQRFTVQIGWLLPNTSKIQTGLQYRFENYTQKTEHIFLLSTSFIFSL